MDNELILRQFDEIEKKVENLLEAFQALEANNRQLHDKVESLNAELQSRIETEEKYAKERDLHLTLSERTCARIFASPPL